MLVPIMNDKVPRIPLKTSQLHIRINSVLIDSARALRLDMRRVISDSLTKAILKATSQPTPKAFNPKIGLLAEKISQYKEKNK